MPPRLRAYAQIGSIHCLIGRPFLANGERLKQSHKSPENELLNCLLHDFLPLGCCIRRDSFDTKCLIFHPKLTAPKLLYFFNSHHARENDEQKCQTLRTGTKIESVIT